MIKKLMILCVAAMAAMGAWAAIETVNGTEWEYEVVNDGAIVVKSFRNGEELPWALESDGVLAVPEKLGGYPVREIGDRFMSGGHDMTLKKVVLPNSIVKIGQAAFEGNNALSEINFPEGLKELSYKSFEECGLEKIIIPEGVTEIPENCFRQCYSLVEVWLPKSLKNIQMSAFEECPKLKAVHCAGEKPKLDSYALYKSPNAIFYFGVGAENHVVSVVVADGCEAFGKVTGGKTAKVGTKVTLKATANKGYVFSHWEGPLGDEIDSRNPSISFVVGENDVEFVAHFVPISDSSDVTLQESYGPFVPGTEVELNLGLVGYTAKKLPSGLKLDKKTGIVKGKAKKPGEYEVTFTKKGAETLTAKFIVGPIPTITISMEGDTEKCKVTGASKPGKGYLVGKKVSLSAKGPKGTAFTGWFKDGLPWPNETEYLEPKLKYVMTEENLSLIARFEKEKMSVACDGLSSLVVGEEVLIPIAIETQSGVKSVKGSKLPTGLKVKKDKATGEWFVTGKPKKKGSWNATITVTAKSGAVEKLPVAVTVEDKGDIVLPSANHYFREPLKNGKGEKYVVSVGISNVEDFLPNLELTKGALDVSGLPEGLKYDAKNGKITGVATKSGTYTVTLTVTDGKAKYVSTITIEVEALPDWVVGTFEGYCHEYGWYDMGRKDSNKTLDTGLQLGDALPGGHDYETIGSFFVEVEDGGEVSCKFVCATDMILFSGRLCKNGDTYQFSENNVKLNRKTLNQNKDNGKVRKGGYAFILTEEKYSNTSRGRVECQLEGYSYYYNDEVSDYSPFYWEAIAWQDLLENGNVPIPKILESKEYNHYYYDDWYNIEGILTLRFKKGSRTVYGMFEMDPKYTPEWEKLAMTKSASKLIVIDYDAQTGIFSALLSASFAHYDDYPFEGECQDLDFLVPLEIDRNGYVDILWNKVDYAHDDWW